MTFDPLEGFDLNPWDNPDDVPGKAMTRAKTLIDELHSAMDGKALHKATTLLAQSRMIDIYGVENSMSPALDLCTKLTYLGLQRCRLQRRRLPAADRRGASDEGRHGHRVLSLRQLRRHRESAETRQIRRRAHHRCHQPTPATPAGQLADVTLLTGRGDMAIYGNAIFSRVAHSITVDMLYMSVILSDYGRFSTELDRSGRIIADREFRG